nr:hypothetical protein GCM10020093_075380 [Planobispora longispora]
MTAGGVPASFTRVSDTRLKVVLPTRAAGTAYVQVTTPGGVSAVAKAAAFTWVASR